MRLTILQENLSKALNIVAKLSTASGQLPILNTVLINAESEGLTFSTTNLELSINYWVGAKVEKTGKVFIPLKQLLEIVSSLSKDKVSLIKKENELLVESKGQKVTLNTLPDEEFPKIPSLKKDAKHKKAVDFTSQEIADCINKVSFAASQDESRAVLTGVMLIKKNNSLELVATDGYRLSQYYIKKKSGLKNSEYTTIIPARAFSELGRMLDQEDEVISLWVDDKENQAIFTFSNGEIVTRLIDGEFPDYTKIIPTDQGDKVEIDREELERLN